MINKLYFLGLAPILLITSCVLPPIPKPTNSTTIIELYAQPGRSLMAERLDDNRVNDGRYFEVKEGKHRLTLIFQYDATETSGLFSNNASTITCIITFDRQFDANTIYQLEARPMIYGSQLLLSQNNKTTVLDYPEVSNNCAPY